MDVCGLMQIASFTHLFVIEE